MPMLQTPDISKLLARRDIKSLVRCLEYSSDLIRQQAAAALAKIGDMAIPELDKAMRQPGASMRIGAALALGLLNSPEALPVLLRGLKDENRQVRLNCVQSIGLCTSPTAVPLLIKYMETEKDPQIHNAVLIARIRLHDGTAWQPILEALGCDDYNLRLLTSESLPQISHLIQDQLISGLTSPNPHVRYASATALEHHPSPKAIVSLIQILVDTDEGVQLAARKALQANHKTANYFLCLALRTKIKQLQRSVVKLLIDDPQTTERTLLNLLPSFDVNDLEIALPVLGSIGTKLSLPYLASYASHSNPSIRYSAVSAIAKMGLEESIPILSTAILDSDQYISCAAQNGLETIHQLSSQPEVKRRVRSLIDSTDKTKIILESEVVANRINELLRIAEHDGFLGENSDHFDSLGRQLQAREIGIDLFKLGGHHLMQSVWSRLETCLGEDDLANLMKCWKEIGGWNAG